MPATKSKSKYSQTDPSLAASSIFEVDTSGLAAIRHSVLHGAYASRARKGVQKTWVHGATREVTKAKFLTASEKRQPEQMVTRKKHGSGISSIDPVKRNSTAVAVKPPQAPAGDMWTEDPSLIPIPAITTKTSQAQQNSVEVVNSVPAAGLMAIPLPHPGQSYNPTLSNHQDILQQTLEKLEEALGDGESDDEQQSNTTKGSTPKSVAKKKTKAQHQHQENEQEQMQMLALQKEAKRVAHTLHKLPKGLKPEGNLWRDWSQSNTRRGKLDNRTRVGLVKGQRFQKG
ncbi:hypothetical protein H4Q26_014639 [Puccinia striiformis f. sp. tritici PST-130]|nr:hypothetical protein H4Q26_014639 [Puccinia striiformis f. sp. tritici PST-130]